MPTRAQEPAAGLGAEEADAPLAGTAGAAKGFVRAWLAEADGSPLAKERVRLLHARDLATDPLPQAIVSAEGRSRVALAGEPIQLVVRLKVPDFGEVYCYADNGGRGYAQPADVDFVADAAATRLRRVREALEAARPLGMPADPELDRHLDAAARPVPPERGAARTAAAYAALAHGLHAGERLALNVARRRIARLARPRRDFRFGILAANAGQRGEAYANHVKRLFDYGTVSWYTWKDEEPAAARIDYGRMDGSIEWCRQNGLEPKGFGYCYMSRGATPEWIRPTEPPAPAGPPAAAANTGEEPALPRARRAFNPRWPYERLRDEYARIVRQTAARYAGKVNVIEVINEAHDKANLWDLTHEQILEMTRATCRAARDGSPNVRRLINHCCLWAEYAKRANPDGSRRWSPFRYLTDCVAAGVEFEVIGLQMYYPQYDLFEIDRMLERFTSFGKSIQITEMAAASQDGFDARSMRPTTAAPGWHGPWSEATQADWAEGIYTLCYSKPQFDAVGWWDMADAGNHFWPHGGLLRADLTPKESYERVAKLQQAWGVAKGA